MIRIEVIANQSVLDYLTSSINDLLPDFLYTIIPLAYGKGKESYKLGNSTWPETNFILFGYAEDKEEEKITKIIQYVKQKNPVEGIKYFILHDCSN